MQSAIRLATRYGGFAILATLVNIGAQAVSIEAYRGSWAIPVSMVLGTGAGLVTKYYLDKRFIFQVRAESLAHDGRLFALYACMGVATTAVFWGVESAFQLVWRADAMRYIGGVIGLAVGYFCKYQLDRRLVFRAIPPTGRMVQINP